MTLRLNLASGTDLRDPSDGWLNLDIVPKWPSAARGCEITWDARKETIPFESGTVDEVVAGYLFLHTPPTHHDPLIREIYRVLKPGGRLEVGEADMAIVMPRWLANPDDRTASRMIWGEMGCDMDLKPDPDFYEYADYDKHCQGFTEATLRSLLSRGGFTNEARRFKRHAAEVYYEMTLEVLK